MNGHARRCRDAIKALGFVENTEITDRHNNGKTYYTHPLAPSEPLSIYGRMNEHVCRVVIDRARLIAGLDTTGAKRRNAAIKERQRIQRQQRAEREAREAAERERREHEASVGLAMRRAMREQAERERLRDQRERELHSLMMPGGGR